MTEPSIFTRIANGEYDGQLDQLFQALKDRRRFAARQRGLENKASMNAGDRVVITDGISPKYLTGTTGTVSPMPPRRPGDVQVDIDEKFAQARQRFGASVGVPANCLRVLAPAS